MEEILADAREAGKPFEAAVSYGEDIRKPGKLVTRQVGDILAGVRGGQWRDAVMRVRSLPLDSMEQKAAKLALPFWTPSGVFTRRDNSHLVKHSGQCGVDLDGLSGELATLTLQRAVGDRFCLAAFRSCRANGVRLIFRVPAYTASQHSEIFPQVADHVRAVYHLSPDTTGKDVSRASFVTFDGGLWLFPAAEVLKVRQPARECRVIHSGISNRCVSFPDSASVSPWSFLGRENAPYELKPDGTAKTHHSLLMLGLRLASHEWRFRVCVEDSDLDEALSAWIAEAKRKGLPLRCKPDDYRRELIASMHGARRRHWFKGAAEYWSRWRNDPGFPEDPSERVLFSIQRQCELSGKRDFYLSARDAALVAGVSPATAARILVRLCTEGRLELVNRPKMARLAYVYRFTPKP